MMKFGAKVEMRLNGKIVAGVVYDYNADMSKIWVETTEDIYVVNAEDVTVVTEPAKHLRKAKKVASGSLEFGTMITEDIFGERGARYQTAYFTIKSNKLTAEELEALYDKAEELLLAELEDVVDCSRTGCPVIEDNYYGDAIEFTADHGCITEAKAEIKKAWKAVKVQLGLR